MKMNLEKIWPDLVLLGVGAMFLVLAITTANTIFATSVSSAFTAITIIATNSIATNKGILRLRVQ